MIKPELIKLLEIMDNLGMLSDMGIKYLKLIKGENDDAN